MNPFSPFWRFCESHLLQFFTAGLLLGIAPLVSSFAEDDDPMKDSSYRSKGRVASGELADYERGEIDWDVLLDDYRDYELPLPGDGAKLLRFPREIWESEGPMRVWHLGFPLPPEKTEAGEIPRVLVGAEVFAFRENSFRAIDRELPDGTIEKAEQFKAEPLTGPWDGKNLDCDTQATRERLQALAARAASGGRPRGNRMREPISGRNGFASMPTERVASTFPPSNCRQFPIMRLFWRHYRRNSEP